MKYLLLSLSFQGTLQNRYWEIQVTQLSCSDPNLAPGGCLQYHTGHTGVIESFNWQNTDAKYHLANQVRRGSKLFYDATVARLTCHIYRLL